MTNQKRRLMPWRSRIIIGLLIIECAGLSACGTPLEQPFLPVDPAPRLESNQLILGKDNVVPVRSWLPDEAEPKAVIIALHGFNDYSNAFAGAGEFMRRRDIALYSYDQRGFGNATSHGIWAGRHNLINDLKQMVLALRQKHPGKPVYLLGESMGGAVVIVSVSSKDFPPVDGVVLSAPAVWGSETLNTFYRGTLWLLAHTVPHQQLTGKGLQIQASDNIPMLQALGSDPLVIKETRVDAIYGIVKLMDSAYNKVADVKVPMLLLYGAKDQVIPRAPISQAIEKVQSPLTVAYYPGGYHMLLRDLKARTVLKDIESWIGNNGQKLPSGFDAGWKNHLQLEASNAVPPVTKPLIRR